MDDMCLIYNINLCRICQIPKNVILEDTSTTTKQGETYLDLLKFIFKDISWLEDQLISLICQFCVQKVKDIAAFKSICLESNNRRGTLNVDLIKFEVDDVEIDETHELKEVFDGFDNGLLDSGYENQMNRRQLNDLVYAQPTSKRIKNESTKSDVPNRSRFRKKLVKKTHEPDKEKRKPKLRSFECPICHMCFERTRTLDRHVFKHTGVRTYICNGCDLKFITHYDLQSHQKQKGCSKVSDDVDQAQNDRQTKLIRVPINKKRNFVCSICQLELRSAKQLERHVFKHNGIRNYTCDGCGIKFITADNLKNHLQNHCKKYNPDKKRDAESKPPNYSCDLCPTDFHRLTSFERHVYQHNGIRNYTCNGCNTKFITREDLKRHLRRHCNEEKLSCFLCPDRQFTPSTLEVHMKTIHMIGINENGKGTLQGTTDRKECKDVDYGKNKEDIEIGVTQNKTEEERKPQDLRGLKCHYCPMEFTQLKYFDRHMYSHDGTRKYICNDCGTRSITIDNLRSHMRVVHAKREDFNFLCTECGAKFAQSSGLKLHVQRVHKDIRNFICGICNKGFGAKRDLRNHMTSHSDVREFKCDLCTAQYKRKDVLLRHKTMQHGIGNYKCQDQKKFECSFCDKKFNVRGKLNRHIRSHTGVKPFKCRMCDMTFTCKSYIKGHVMSKHSDLVDQHDFEVSVFCEVLEDDTCYITSKN